MRFGFPLSAANRTEMLPSECVLCAGASLNKKLKYAAAAIVVFAAAIYLNNTNHLAAHRDGNLSCSRIAALPSASTNAS